MQAMLRVVAIALGLTAGGCATTSGPLSALGSTTLRSGGTMSDAYLGNWQGTVLQSGAPRPYAVEIDLYREPDGRLRAVSLYPEFGCVGKLTTKSAEAQKVVFEEALEPAQHCGPRREFTLIWSIDGRVIYAAARPPAQGTLVRASTSGGMASVLERFFGAQKPAAIPAGAKPARPAIGEMAQAADSILVRWSQVWSSERYILGSPRIGEVLWNNKVYVVKGSFEVEVNRQTGKRPFAAELQPRGGSFEIAGLCIYDASKMQRCFDAESVRREIRQQDLKLLLTMGMLGAISSIARDLPPDRCTLDEVPVAAALAEGTNAAGNPVVRQWNCPLAGQ